MICGSFWLLVKRFVVLATVVIVTYYEGSTCTTETGVKSGLTLTVINRCYSSNAWSSGNKISGMNRNQHSSSIYVT